MQRQPRPFLFFVPLAVLFVASVQIASVYAAPPLIPVAQEQGQSADESRHLLAAHIACVQTQMRGLALTTSATAQEAAVAALISCENSEEKYLQANRKLPGSTASAMDELKNNLRQRLIENAPSIVEAARAQKPRIDAERTRLKQLWFENCQDDNAGESKQQPDYEGNFSGFCGCMSAELSRSFDDYDIAYGWTVGRVKQAMSDAHDICKPRFFEMRK